MAIRVHAMDVPDERKVHPFPMPKSGGVAMALGVIIPVLFLAPGDLFVRAVLIGAVIVALFGLVDDFRNIGYKTKFVGQLAAALIVIFYGGVKIKCLGMLLPDDVFLPDWLAVSVTVFVIVGVTNAINLSDGLDGLAGGICLLSFICIGYLAYQGENVSIAVLSAAVAGAIFGFLRFNTYPATLFMGDAGSQLLGFLAVTLSLGLTQGNTPLSPILPLILLGFPILDTLTVMFERIAEGRSPFVADKNHFHHKLIRLGLYHTEAVFIIYALQAFLVTSTFVFRFYSEWFLLTAYIIFSGVIISVFFVSQRTGWQVERRNLVDTVIKGRLKIFKDKNILIKVSFRIIQAGVPLLLLFSCFLPRSVPVNVSLSSMGLLGIYLVVWRIKKEWLNTVIGMSLYLFIPFVIYMSEKDTVAWMNDKLALPYNLSFGLFAFLVILTLKFTRRRKGFEINTMHFLVLFIALVVPNLPDEWIQSHHMGLVAAKVIVLFFSYEILVGELRGGLNKLWLATAMAVVVVAVRGFIG